MAEEIIIIVYGQQEIIQEFDSNREKLVTKLVDVIRGRKQCKSYFLLGEAIKKVISIY
jgi:hypothetical protein